MAELHFEKVENGKRAARAVQSAVQAIKRQLIKQRPHVKQGRRTIDNQRSARISASYRD
jgi:hypothetical protein